MDLQALSLGHQLALVLATCVFAYCAFSVVAFAQGFMHRARMLKGVPMAPESNWFLGHALAMMLCVSQNKGAWDILEDWLDVAGDIVQIRVLGTHSIVVKDPRALKRIFQTRFKVYEKDLKLSYDPFLPILGTGLVTSDGDLWQKQRSLIGPALRVDILDDIITIAMVAVERLITKLKPLKGSGTIVNMEEEFRLLTLQVIGEAVLSMAPEECDEVFPQLYLPVMEEANTRVLRPHRKYLPTPDWFRFRSRMTQLNRYIIGYCRKRWEQLNAGQRPARSDVLDKILMAIKDASTPWNAALETQLCYEIKTFLLAGHETSAAMLTWATYELACDTKIRDQVAAEAFVALGSGPEDEEPSRKTVDGMAYTLAVLREVLRKYSVVPVVTRTLTCDDELMGHTIPKGTMVACHIQGTHNMYKEPKVFRPERFMPDGEFDQFDDEIRTFMFVPFIAGPRNCLGQHLALLEARVVLSALVKNFKFRNATDVPPLRSPTVIPVAPVGGMNFYLE